MSTNVDSRYLYVNLNIVIRLSVAPHKSTRRLRQDLISADNLTRPNVVFTETKR